MSAIAKTTPEVAAPSAKPTFFTSVKTAVKSAYHLIAADFIVLTIIVGNLIKGSQGVGIFSITSTAVKQALATLTAARATYEGVESAFKAATIFGDRAKLFEHVKNPNPRQLKERRIEDLTAACTYIQENGKSLHKSLKIAKDVKIAERANKILEDIGRKTRKSKLEALEKGEVFVKTLRRRANTQLGFALANVATRVGALALSVALVFTAANPVILTLTGIVGLGILGVIVGQKIMLPSNPFDEPPKESKLQTIAFKIRTAVYNASDRLEATFHTSRAAAAA